MERYIVQRHHLGAKVSDSFCQQSRFTGLEIRAVRWLNAGRFSGQILYVKALAKALPNIQCLEHKAQDEEVNNDHQSMNQDNFLTYSAILYKVMYYKCCLLSGLIQVYKTAAYKLCIIVLLIIRKYYWAALKNLFSN